MTLEFSQIKNESFTTTIASEAHASGKSKKIEAEHFFDHDDKKMMTIFRVYINGRHVSTTGSIEMAIDDYNLF